MSLSSVHLQQYSAAAEISCECFWCLNMIVYDKQYHRQVYHCQIENGIFRY